MLRGLFLTAMGDPERREEGFTDNLCGITCSSGMVRALALAGCGGEALGLLENSVVLDYISSDMVCPVSDHLPFNI